MERLSGLPIPADALEAARNSVQAAAIVAEQAPAEGRQIILDATRDAFLEGMHSGVRVAAVATAIGAVTALVFLPARGVDLNATEAADRSVAA